MAHDVAVARDVRGHHRGARGKRLGQHHAEALAAQRGGAQQVGLAQQAPLLVLAHAAQHLDALGLEQQRANLVVRGARHGQPGSHARAAQRLEGPQQHGQPLALLRAPDEQQAQLAVLVAGPARPGRREVHAVGHDPVAAAVAALRGPAGRLGDGDPAAQLRVEAPQARHVGAEQAECDVRGVGVEGGDRGHPGRLGGVPARRPGVGLVDVHDVVAAAAELASERRHRAGAQGEVRHRSVHREAHRAAERHQVVGQGPPLGRGASMGYTRQAVVGVVRRQHPHVVAFAK